MKILYIDCNMGAAGDMMTGALLELLPGDEQERMLEKLNAIGLPGVSIKRNKVSKCGIKGSHVEVHINGETESLDDAGKTVHEHETWGNSHPDHDHSHMHMSDIEEMIRSLDISDKVKEDSLSVYRLIAEAESRVHGMEVSEVHFHEVGMKDAIMDVAAVCFLMDMISPDKIVVSPVHVGSGQVNCAHGVMPIPAPATAYILKGVPIYSTEVKGELCTPTGAALIKFFADGFAPMPLMTTECIGYGMGTKDYPVANCVRITLGEALVEACRDTVIGLSCNVDDMTGEEIGFAMERLYEAGAKEVYTVPVGMKKSRPGILLEILCASEDKDALIRAVFKYTTTIGIRETEHKRHILKRTEEDVDTEFGRVRLKRSEGYGVIREKYEYDDAASLAAKKGFSLRQMRDKLGVDYKES